MPDRITILERWTQTSGQRKIGDGPWEDIDLSLYGGRVPFVFWKEPPEGLVWETVTWMTPEEARLRFDKLSS
jgi:hypothetical protein